MGASSRRVGLTDAGFYEVVVDLVGRVLGAGRLYDVHILSTDSLLDLAPALADLKLGEGAITLRDTEDVADIVDELRVGVAPEDDKIADHLCSAPVEILGDTDGDCNAVLDEPEEVAGESWESAQMSAGPRSRSRSWATDVTKVAEGMRG